LHDSSIRWYPLFVALLIIPMGMIQLIKYLVPFSIIANGLISAGTVVLFYFIFTDDGGRDPLLPEERSKLVVWPITRWSLFAGSALCSMEGVGMVSIVFLNFFFLLCKPPLYNARTKQRQNNMRNYTIPFRFRRFDYQWATKVLKYCL